ncbi:hypothetical protein [Micromonospora arida]
MKGYEFRPTASVPGDAWLRLVSLERAGGMAFLRTWHVFVLLPQDEQGAADWIDEHCENLADVLERVAFVKEFEPIQVGAGNAAQFLLQITIEAE